ncbi:LysE family translocator [Chelatococcus sp. SYSU_G07232]|uniref:LysE family translocator n=1 Tax=Chelatococcus albus TaxID=3047466 RepID=A0ABT7AIN3_9HYPH|nr:LysE family translocator [Chelatococcus sp. SYSU_G07232]MDJ1158857.1 LysE family translocator [Chelatococcus sp. SYSU_G07232]
MDLAGLVVFAGALFVAAASPGPGVVAIVARVLGRGREGAIAFAAGVAVGDVVWLTFAVLGLAVLAQTFHAVFLVIRYAGAAYLLWLAWELWSAPAERQAIAGESRREHPVRLFLAGLALTLGNPKVVVFYVALLPNILDLGRVTPLGYAELVVVTELVLALVFAGYMLLAERARSLVASPRAMRIVNRATGGVMAGAAVAVATR